MESASQWIVLAQILRPQGRKGEVLADLFTDFPDRFTTQPRVWLAPAGFADSPAAESVPTDPLHASLQQATVAAFWLPTGRNAGRIVLHFTGVDSIEQAEKLAGREVLVPLAERHPLDEDAAYISDLVGSTVYDRDRPIGTVASVEFPTTPDGARRLDEAAPLLALTSPTGDEILIPFVRAYLVHLDPAHKSIHMLLPAGLAEINLQPATSPNRAAEK